MEPVGPDASRGHLRVKRFFSFTPSLPTRTRCQVFRKRRLDYLSGVLVLKGVNRNGKHAEEKYGEVIGI